MNAEIKGKISIIQCKRTMENLNHKLNMKKKKVQMKNVAIATKSFLSKL
ncbi:hypothetical protein NC651_002072 [Populus alba x Populus x berolinensis]|nr:hypothetical protein NC651_002072 [Populus alba x Populus x berolinensis]